MNNKVEIIQKKYIDILESKNRDLNQIITRKNDQGR
jgi:hypothetical protein